METTRIENLHNNVVVFASHAAVGLIVQDRVALPEALRQPRDHTGAFFTPSEARDIAAALLLYADEADVVANTPVDRDASIKAFLAKTETNERPAITELKFLYEDADAIRNQKRSGGVSHRTIESFFKEALFRLDAHPDAVKAVAHEVVFALDIDGEKSPSFVAYFEKVMNV
jgi:hypothetical protein